MYKRLGDTASYNLAKPLRTFDKEIHLDDATNISAPDKNSKQVGTKNHTKKAEYRKSTGKHKTLKYLQMAHA